MWANTDYTITSKIYIFEETNYRRFKLFIWVLLSVEIIENHSYNQI